MDTQALAKFDFYLPEYNLCIEYDGIQHFKVIGWNTQEKLNKTQEHDKIKDLYCKNNNIQLLRISYQDNYKEKILNYLNIANEQTN